MPVEATIELPEKQHAHTPLRSVTDLAISGMTCGNCARHVTEALQSVPGVRSATVDLDAEQASVRWEVEGLRNVRAAIQAVEKAGYGAKALEARAHNHAEHRLAGWQINLWIGL